MGRKEQLSEKIASLEKTRAQIGATDTTIQDIELRIGQLREERVVERRKGGDGKEITKQILDLQSELDAIGDDIVNQKELEAAFEKEISELERQINADKIAALVAAEIEAEVPLVRALVAAEPAILAYFETQQRRGQFGASNGPVFGGLLYGSTFPLVRLYELFTGASFRDLKIRFEKYLL